MTETADLNDSTESLFTVFRGRLFQFRIVAERMIVLCCTNFNVNLITNVLSRIP